VRHEAVDEEGIAEARRLCWRARLVPKPFESVRKWKERGREGSSAPRGPRARCPRGRGREAPLSERLALLVPEELGIGDEARDPDELERGPAPGEGDRGDEEVRGPPAACGRADDAGREPGERECDGQVAGLPEPEQEAARRGRRLARVRREPQPGQEEERERGDDGEEPRSEHDLADSTASPVRVG
jgi:hypothetical protein